MTYKLEIYFDIDEEEGINDKFLSVCMNSKRAIYSSGVNHVYAPKILDIFDKQLFPIIKEEAQEEVESVE